MTAGGWLFTALLATPVAAQTLIPRLNGDSIHLTAPRLRFLSGRPLERLKNGSAVSYACQLTLAVNSNTSVLAQTLERFGFSYDLWEEKFAVTRLTGQEPKATASHLPATTAEAWCLDQLTLPTAGLSPDRPFWLRLELRAEEDHEPTNNIPDPGVLLTRLVEIFSRPARAQQLRWLEEAGPLRLADLRKR
jgi:hypothetical protein